MIQKRTTPEISEANPLSPEQQALLEELQTMYAAGCEEIPQEFVSRFDKMMHWSYDDPVSIERSLYFAAHDPYYMGEMQAINQEFASAEADGLRHDGSEDY